MTPSRSPSSWPSLPEPEAWLEAYETLHLWSQIVGKVKMSETPLINHWWNVALFVGPDGLTTGSIPSDRGAFDLAVTRFSGREAPLHPGGVPNCADWVMHEAYSHEVSSAGFWPGAGLGEAAFYSYAYPEPDGYREATDEVEGAYFDEDLGEFVLPYERVRSSDAPGEHVMTFLQSTYEAAADLGNWDRDRLERSTDYRPDH